MAGSILQNWKTGPVLSTEKKKPKWNCIKDAYVLAKICSEVKAVAYCASQYIFVLLKVKDAAAVDK